MTCVVIDASAGAEIITATARGRALARLLTAADAVYVALAEKLGASLLTDDHRLARSPTFPTSVPVLQLPLW